MTTFYIYAGEFEIMVERDLMRDGFYIDEDFYRYKRAIKADNEREALEKYLAVAAW